MNDGKATPVAGHVMSAACAEAIMQPGMLRAREPMTDAQVAAFRRNFADWLAQREIPANWPSVLTEKEAEFIEFRKWHLR